MVFKKKKRNIKVKETNLSEPKFKKVPFTKKKSQSKPIKIEKIKNIEKLKTKVTPISPDTIINKKSKLTVDYWKQKKAKRLYKHSFIANIELRNGTFRTVHVQTNNKGFRFDNADYLLDEECNYYNVDFKDYMADYHQDFSLPIKRHIPLNKLNEKVRIEQSEIELTTNPTLLKRFVTSEIAEGIMKGAEISDFFKQIKLILIITAVMVAICLFILVKGSGMLENMSLPF